MSGAQGQSASPWRRQESSRDAQGDAFSKRSPPKLSIDVYGQDARAQPGDAVTSPTAQHAQHEEADDQTPKRARAVMQLMTSGRVSLQLQQNDIFTLFIGGYAGDFNAERHILHTKVLPQVARWCLDAGIEFDAVDMMHCTNNILPPGPGDATVCKREAVECLKRSSMGLKYICFIGNKVGPRPLPEKISKTVFHELLSSCHSKEDKDLVHNWYILSHSLRYAHDMVCVHT